MKKTFKKFMAISASIAVLLSSIGNMAVMAADVPIKNAITTTFKMDTASNEQSDILVKTYTMAVNKSGRHVNIGKKSADYQSLTGAADWGAVRGKKMLINTEALRTKIDDPELIGKVTLSFEGGIFSDLSTELPRLDTPPESGYYTKKDDKYIALSDTVTMGIVETNLSLDDQGVPIRFEDLNNSDVDGEDNILAKTESVLYRHIDSNGPNTVVVDEPICESTYIIPEDELLEVQGGWKNINNIKFEFDLTESMKAALASGEGVKAYALWISDETKTTSVRNLKGVLKFEYISEDEFVQRASTSENTDSYILYVLSSKKKDAYKALAEEEKEAVRNVIRNTAFDSLASFAKTCSELVTTVGNMQEEDMAEMSKLLIQAYMNKFISETDIYADFTDLSKEGKSEVINLIDEVKSTITDKAVLEEVTKTSVERYFKSDALIDEDIDNLFEYFLVDSDFYDGLSEIGRISVNESFINADRSEATDAEKVGEILDSSIAEYYASGAVEIEDYQLEIMTSNSQNLVGNDDASIDGVAGGIKITAPDVPELNLANVKLYCGDEEIPLTVNGTSVIPQENSIVAETEYKLVWTDLADGIYDSRSAFFTTGLYIDLNAGLSIDNFKETKTIDYTGTTAIFSSGKEKEVSADNLIITVDDTNIASYENTKFTAHNRGITAVTFEKTNEGGAESVTAKRILSVYLKLKKGNFATASKTVTADFDADVFSTYFTVTEPVEFTLTVDKDTTFSVNAEKSGEHQAVIVSDDGMLTLYVDGEKVSQENYTKKFNTVKAGNATSVEFSNTNIMNVFGTPCEATNVKIIALGKKMQGEYVYSDDDSDDRNAELGTTYQWYLASGSSKKAISGETSQTLNTADYAGEKVVFGVTPANKHETGEEYFSEPYSIPKKSSNGGGGSSGGGSSSGNSSGSDFILSYPIGSTPVTDNKTETKPEDKNSFIDIDNSHWAYESVSNLVEKNVLKGYEDGTFKPSVNVTRAEFVCALVKAIELPLNEYADTFSDVQKSDWYAQYVASGVNAGLINGFEDGSFGPDQLITREQIALIISNACKLSDISELSFNDNSDISQWANDAVSKICAAGIMQGRDGNMFAPKANATRAEMAVILERALQMLKL